MIGEIVSGRYQIESLITSDYIGRLYQATDLFAERQVTLRFFDFIPAEELQAAFNQLQAQMKALSAIDIPGLIRPTELGRHNYSQYLVANYPGGVSLESEMELAPLAMERVIHIGIEIGQLLETLHDEGIVHGDLRPVNVILKPTLDLPLVKLAGLGAAVTMDLSAVEDPGLAYLAPERIRGGIPTAGSDLYSLGVILFELSTGQLPAWEPGGLTIAQPPRQLNPWVPASLETLILELLAQEPASRPADARSVVQRLAQTGQNDLFPPDQPAPSDEEELPGPPSWEM